MSDDPEEERTRADAGAARRCSTCGARIDATEWHPLTTRVDDDGAFRVHAFCGADCRAAWNGE